MEVLFIFISLKYKDNAVLRPSNLVAANQFISIYTYIMLTIRLQRAGKKNKADYRVVLAEKTAASQKKFTEVLGSYNPHTKALNIRNPERLNYWVDEQHVELSATVRNLFVSNNLIKGDKTKAFTIPKKEVVAEEVAPEAPADAPATDVPAETEAPAEQVAEAIEENAPQEVETPAEAAPEAPAETPVPVEEPAPEVAPEPTEEKSA